MALFRRTKKRDEPSIVDSVTGAFNRRQLDRDIKSGVVSDQPTSTLMIDIDDFERYTGKKGEVSPDQVLERVAWVIMATVRTTDVVYRHDNSSFCVLLPSTSDADALVVAERIRGNVEKMPLLSTMSVSISIGVASGPSDDVAGAVDRALEALDRAVQNNGTGDVAVASAVSTLAPANAPLAPPAADLSGTPASAPSPTLMPPPGPTDGAPLPPPAP